MTETVLDIKPTRSVSQLTSFLSCGEAYRLQRIAKAPRKPAAWLLQGIAFHSAIEFWELDCRKPTVEQCIAEFDTTWALEVEMLPDVPLDQWLTGGKTKGEVDYERRVAKGRQQVREHIEWALAHSEEWRVMRDSRFPNGLGIEIPISIDLGALTLNGFIDQVIEYRTGEVRVRDLKTGSKKPDSPVQLGVYAMSLREQWELPQVWWGDFYMAKDTNATTPYDLSVYTRQTVGEWFTKLNAAIEAELFIPNPGSMCAVCDVWQWCSVQGPNRGEY